MSSRRRLPTGSPPTIREYRDGASGISRLHADPRHRLGPARRRRCALCDARRRSDECVFRERFSTIVSPTSSIRTSSTARWMPPRSSRDISLGDYGTPARWRPGSRTISSCRWAAWRTQGDGGRRRPAAGGCRTSSPAASSTAITGSIRSTGRPTTSISAPTRSMDLGRGLLGQRHLCAHRDRRVSGLGRRLCGRCQGRACLDHHRDRRSRRDRSLGYVISQTTRHGRRLRRRPDVHVAPKLADGTYLTARPYLCQQLIDRRDHERHGGERAAAWRVGQ